MLTFLKGRSKLLLGGIYKMIYGKLARWFHYRHCLSKLSGAMGDNGKKSLVQVVNVSAPEPEKIPS